MASKLLFDGIINENYKIWFANTHAQRNLNELVANIPVAEELNTLIMPQVHWLPDNNRILFQDLLAYTDPLRKTSAMRLCLT